MEREAQEAMKEARKLNLNPEGQRVVSQMGGKLRAIQGQRGVSLRPNQYAAAMGSFLDEFGRSRLEDYAVEEISGEEKLKQKTATDAQGNVYTFDRNDVPKVIRQAPLTQEQILANTYALPNGSSIFVNPNDPSDRTVFPAEKAGSDGALKPTEKTRIYFDARRALMDEWQVANPTRPVLDEFGRPKFTRDEDGKTVPATEPIPFREFLEANLPAELERFNRAFAEEPTGAPYSNAPPNAFPSPPHLGVPAPSMTRPPVEITNRTEADALQVNDTFFFGGQLWIKTGDGQAEPVEMQ